LSVHTVYFWTNPTGHLREIRRVLRNAGRLVLACRSKEDNAAENFPGTVYTFYTADELTGLLQESGFATVDIMHRPGELIIAGAQRPPSD